jgi:hypothetical protein
VARLRLRRHHEPDDAAPADARPAPLPHAARRAAPSPGELRRERRTLLGVHEARLRDLGGVVLEMYRQDDFRESLLWELCAEVSAIEERLQEVEVLLGAYRPAAARCGCGAPLFWGARFCASCGRPLADGAAPPGAS